MSNNEPLDDTGQLRYRIRELLGVENLNGMPFSDDELEQIYDRLDEARKLNEKEVIKQ